LTSFSFDFHPVVSVVLPVKNAGTTVGAQLEALSKQDFAHAWELIVVDNASTDDTKRVISEWADEFACLRHLDTEVKGGAGPVRNVGTRAARADLIAYCDGDDEVSVGWLRGLVEVLAHHDLATGPRDLTRLNSPIVYSWRRPMPGNWPTWLGYLPELSTCNLGVRREAFERAFGFDGGIRLGQDNDFGWRVQLGGGTLGFAEHAVVHYRMRTGWSYFRRYFIFGVGQVQQYKRYRSLGMPRRPWVGALRLVAATVSVPVVMIPSLRYRWMTSAATSFGRLRGSILFRVIYL
jgi:glycosyltransferase involved in cell wall biosynthesis